MKNIADYKAGWTKKVSNPKTGKTCSGGASRNLQIAAVGGVVAIYNQGGLDAVNLFAPLIEQLQERLEASERLNRALLERLEALTGEPRGEERTSRRVNRTRPLH